MRDPSLVHIFEEHEITPLAKEAAALCPRKDCYLAELAQTSADKVLVTTDRELRAQMDGQAGITALLLEEFTERYLHRPT